jgi:hypothetical protein
MPLAKRGCSGKSARTVCVKLRDVYEPESLARTAELYSQLIAIQQQPWEDIAGYFEQAEHLRVSSSQSVRLS